MLEKSYLDRKKISLRIFLLILIFFIFITLLFGWMVKHSITNLGNRFHNIEKIIIEIASIPEIIFKLNQNDFEVNRFNLNKNEYGLKVYSSDPKDLEGYLLLPQYYIDKKKYFVDILELKSNKIIKTYNFDVEKIHKKSNNFNSTIPVEVMDLNRDRNNSRYGYQNAFLDKNGDLIFKHESPLISIDKCNNLNLTVDEYFHHSINKGLNNTLWIPSKKTPGIYADFHSTYHDDEITQLNKKGEILFQKSVTTILIENNLKDLITSSYYGKDPIHLNDIEPVIDDSKFWKKGDIFLSLRNISMVFLYRPSNNKVIWYKQGPWVRQHDIDIIDESKISIYNNNINLQDNGVSKTNNIVIYDFNSDSFSFPFNEAFEKHNVKTFSSGLVLKLTKNDAIVEETDFSRILKFNKKGDLKWQYIWNGSILWSRFLDEDEYSETIKLLKENDC